VILLTRNENFSSTLAQTATSLALAKRRKPASVYTLYNYVFRQFIKHSLLCARLLQDEEGMFGYKTVTKLQFP